MTAQARRVDAPRRVRGGAGGRVNATRAPSPAIVGTAGEGSSRVT
jgi:hypothetical protein